MGSEMCIRDRDGESGGHRTEERIGLETERLRLLGDWVKEGMER